MTVTPVFGPAGEFLDYTTDNKLVINDISDPRVYAQTYYLKFALQDTKTTSFFTTILIINDAIPPKVPEPELPKLDCSDVALVAPETDSSISYKAGTSPAMFSWTQFELTGSVECTKEVKFLITLSSSWEDPRFTRESDWLSYTSKSITADNETSYVVVKVDSMAAPDISAALKVTAFAKLPDGKELQASF